MDEDSIDIEAEAWRRDRLGDEPIYCAAPPPSNPDDIICFGSDEELDDDAKIAKRLRYETQGLRYLHGKPPRLFSASLHGPFEKASGWNNPWLPKHPVIKDTVPTSQPTSKPLPAVKQRLRKYLERNNTTPGTSNTMRCHLPSPESNRELPLARSPPETDKHSRIQAWAKDVSRGTVLEKDAFWAPNQVYSEEADGSSKKRPAGKDWLKKQSKRKRLDTPQDPATASTSETQDCAKQACEDLINEQLGQSPEADDISSESYIDESFHYRTRPAKQTMNMEEPTTDTCPEPTQTRTPSSPVHEDTVDIAVSETKKLPQLPQSSPLLKQQVFREQEAFSQRAKSLPDPMNYQKEGSVVESSKVYFSVPSRSKIGASKDQQPPIENSDSPDNSSHNVLIPPENTITLPVESETIRNDEQKPVHNDLHITQTLHEEKVAILSGIIEEAKTHPTGSRLMVNAGSTSDLMDIDGSTLYEANRLSTSHHVSKGPIPEVIPTVELNEPMEIAAEKATRGDESGTKSNLVIVPQSRLERGVAEIPGRSAEESNIADDSKASILDVKAEEVFYRNDSTQVAQLDHSGVSSPRSPWVTELAPGADLTIEYVKSEPVDDIPSASPCPSHFTLLSSQPSGHGTPMIRPSQQSPWGGRLLEPLEIGQHGLNLTDVETIPTHTHPITTLSQVHQSPWAESSTSLMPYPEYSHLSPAPVISNEEPLQPHIQLSTANVGLDNQCPEPSNENPTTPPRVPASNIRTPDLERSIKSFAMFNSPSPKRQGQQPTRYSSSTSHPRGTFPLASNSGRSNRRVTFALFPDDGDDTEPRRPLNIERAASPPPQTIVNTEDDDMGELFHNHFDIMKRRASGEKIRRRSRPLLPSSSQQMSMSPSVGAMAEAFQVADAYTPHARDSPVEDIKENSNQEVPGGEQSPWRKESQGVDDVADVMNNLDDFLNAWDVDSELQKVKQMESRLKL